MCVCVCVCVCVWIPGRGKTGEMSGGQGLTCGGANQEVNFTSEHSNTT